MKNMTLVAAIKEYFGPHPTISLMNELKALTPEDKDYFRREFEKVGYHIQPSVL
jgi:hypothetical protein